MNADVQPLVHQAKRIEPRLSIVVPAIVVPVVLDTTNQVHQHCHAEGEGHAVLQTISRILGTIELDLPTPTYG